MHAENADLTFWNGYLRNTHQRHQFLADKTGGGNDYEWIKTEPLFLSPSVTTTVKHLCKQHQFSMHLLAVTAFQLLLCRYTEAADVIVGTNRQSSYEHEAGTSTNFTQLLPLRLTHQAAQSFLKIMRDNEEAFTLITARTGTFLPAFVDHHKKSDAGSVEHFHNLLLFCDEESRQYSDLLHIAQNKKIQILLSVLAIENSVQIEVHFRSDLFSVEQAESVLHNYHTFVSNLVAQPEGPTDRIDIISERERGLIANCLEDDYQAEYSFEGKAIPQQFASFAKETPEATAIQFLNGESITYAELDAESNTIASYLQKKGVKKGDLVGLCVSRSQLLVPTIIAVLKLGAIYIPMDPGYPESRLQYIAEDSGLQHLLYNNQATDKIFSDSINRIDLTNTKADEAVAFTFIQPQPEDLSHIIYTSGSTGLPKGVKISHKNVLALLDWVRQTYTQAELKSVLFSTSICFDLSVFEIWAPLSSGGSIFQVESAIELCFQTIDSLTMINTVPSALKMLLEEEAIPEQVSVINVAGEPLFKELVNSVFAGTKVEKVYNLYGPTEDTTYSTYSCMTGFLETEPTIGKPITHTFARILDSNKMRVPLGGIGELYLGGFGVSNGYLNKDDLTRQRFIHEDDNTRLYATGDLVKLLPDGQLMFLGRKDHQVKIRGFRIELGEIENVLASLESVSDAVAIVKNVNQTDSIVAYITANKSVEISLKDLSKDASIHVKQHLPDYMVPQYIIPLKTIPLTSNGKYDRERLKKLQDVKIS